MTSVSAGHIILTLNPGPPDQESRALPNELPRPLPPPNFVQFSPSHKGKSGTNHTQSLTQYTQHQYGKNGCDSWNYGVRQRLNR